MTERVFYDDALPKFAAIAVDVLGDAAVVQNVFLRDAAGRLTLVLKQDIKPEERSEIIRRAEALYPYVDPPESAVASPEELFDTTLKLDDVGEFERFDRGDFTGFVRVFERRVVGQDWLQAPRPPIQDSPTSFVFASHKGGVGRSTALAVAAFAFAEVGLNVLVVDLDLEAPGLGSMLSAPKDLPKFGTLDYFVESTLGEVDQSFLLDMVSVSSLTRGKGVVHYCPAVGLRGDQSPHNVLGKIARAYLETATESGQTITFLDRARNLVQALSSRRRYDVILVDSRAGLNEATAAAVLGLGADVLLFGVDTPQTFSGYKYFLSYLERFRPASSTDLDWRARLRMVQAKAPANAERQAQFRTKTFDLFADTIYDLEEGIEAESFNFDYDDTDAPHFAWPVLNDSNYLEFDPLIAPDQLTSSLYGRTFGTLIDGMLNRMTAK